MKFLSFIKSEFSNFTYKEKIIFPLLVLSVMVLSFLTKGDNIALIYALFGISYTIFAGKGRIICYLFGISASCCYSFISFKSGFFGSFFLNFFIYLPLQIYGIYKWKKNLGEKGGVIKTKLNNIEAAGYFLISLILSFVFFYVLKFANDSSPYLDSIITVFSLSAFVLTAKRCIEQWFFWSIVNFCSVLMWVFAFLNGANSAPAIFMWLIYFILGIYFYFQWKKDLSLKN